MTNINNPKISVVIPTYNCAKYVSRAIDSVLEQTFKEYEIIVVDDGSTDNTKHTLLKYAKDIKYLYQKNSGISVARNPEVLEAQGEYKLF